MDVHERDRPVVTAIVRDIKSLIRVEARSELANVRFGGYVERDSRHRRFVAGRAHERYEHRTRASRVPERR